MLLQSGSFVDAERLCLLLLKSESENSKVWFYLGAARQFQRKLPEALVAFQKSALLNPDNINVLTAKASCYEQLGRMQDAYKTLARVDTLAPENADTIANMAVVLAKLGRQHEALEHYDRALKLDSANRVALLNRGVILAHMGRPHEGLEHYLQAHHTYPQDIDILYNLVDALIGVFAYQEALCYCDKGLQSQPNHAYLLFKKGMALSCLRRFSEAQTTMSLAQIVQPSVLRDLLPYLRNLAYTSVYVDARTLYLEAMFEEQKRCFWKNRDQYITEFAKNVLEPKAAYKIFRQRELGFAIFSLSIDAPTRLKFLQSVSEYIEDGVWVQEIPPFIHNPRAKKRLRIAYMSPDFRKHPIGFLTRNIYALHDRESFEIVGYSLVESTDDPIYEDIKKSCDVFRDLSQLDVREAALQIHEDAIDILVDLAGYTTFSRTEILACRPAPLQISYLGYMGTMGADFIDYAILDDVLCPQPNHPDWHEAVLKLPNSTLVYDTNTPNAPHAGTRAEHGLPDNAFVFCCLNASYKIEPGIFSVWMRILERTPISVLLLAAAGSHTEENLRSEAIKAGVSSTRLIFAEKLSLERHLPRYQLADLFLDTFWQNAYTTAADALWQGLPILTCAGEVASSRLAASLLHAMEIPELICKNMLEYEEKAVYYASNPVALTALKQKVGNKRDTAPLFDIPRTVRALERGYKLAWQRYLKGLTPDAIIVPDDIFDGEAA